VQIHYNIENFKSRNPVVTVGIFDGVHRGHKYIINRLIEIAEVKGGESVVITLWPHPRHVLNHDPSLTRLITTLDEKIQILSEFDISHLVILDFTHEFSRLLSHEFIKNILVDKIGIKHLVVGYNHRFGTDREGDILRLQNHASKHHFTVEQLLSYGNGQQIISSSLIRDALLNGDIRTANESLGHRFFISGKVIGGSRIGRSIGFPTANIRSEHPLKLLPKDGVYAAKVLIRDTWHFGMLNIGIRPTINDNPEHKTIEVHIIDFDKDIYNQQVRIDLEERIRDEMKFATVDMLRDQLLKDKKVALEVFKRLDTGKGNT